MPSGEGAELAYFKGCADDDPDSKRVAYLNGSDDVYWTLRSPYGKVSEGVMFIVSNGNWGYNNCSGSYGIRPALILPSTLGI